MIHPQLIPARSSPKAARIWIMLLPAAFYLTAFYLIPVAGLLLDSFLQSGELSLDAYREAFGRDDIFATILFSLQVALIVTAIVVTISYPIAHYMTTLRGFSLSLAVTLVVLPLMTSVVVRSYALTAFLSNIGIVNTLLIHTGVVSGPIEMIYNPIGIYIGLVQIMLPFAVFPMYSSMRNVDVNLVKAASSLGAGGFYVFRDVYLPLTIPAVASAAILVFIASLSAYVTPLLLGSERDAMIANAIAYEVQQSLNWPLAGALSLILFVITMVGLIGYLHLASRQSGLNNG